MSSLNENAELRLRVNRDIVNRTRPGVIAYPLFWPVLTISADLHISHPQLTLWMGILFLATTIARFIHMGMAEKCNQHRHKAWNIASYLILLPHSVGWGSAFALSMLIDNPTFAFFMAFSSAGIISGGSFSFAPNKKLGIWFLASFSLPPLIASIFFAQQFAITAMLIFYIAYLLKLSLQQGREYWLSLANEQALTQQSRTDALTKLKNRRYFDEKLIELCNVSSRDNSWISILLIDCDNFKSINDTYGHDFGDECLKRLALTLGKALQRSSETCARYGGEEFSIILPGTNTAGAKIVAERIRELVESETIEFNQHQAQLTVSIGMVSQKTAIFDQQLPSKLFKFADDALYQAKQRGRNCCISANDYQEI